MNPRIHTHEAILYGHKLRCYVRRRVSETLTSRYSQHGTLYYLIKHDAARDREWVRPSTPRYSNHYKRWPPNLCLLQHSASGLSSERKTCAFSAQRLHTSTTSYESVYTCTWSNNVLTLCMHTEHGSQQTGDAPSLLVSHTSMTTYEAVYTYIWSNHVWILCMHTERGSQPTSAAPSLFNTISN